MTAVPASERPKVSLLYNPRVRTIAYQTLLCAIIAFLAWSAVNNAIENLRRARIASGFEFWKFTSGFDISQTLIDYSSTATYGRAFWVGLINTLVVAAIGIVLATIVGFLAGIARLSKNWLLSRLAGGYVELIRNLPLLLQLLFWYNAVLKALPEMRDSLTLPGGGFLNNRGLFLPQPNFQGVIEWVWVALGLVVGLPLIVYFLAGQPIALAYPQKGRFNISGALELLPEFVALLFGLVIYTGAFIAEVVRAGILAVSHGQTEAAYSLGLRPGPTLRLVVIPQAMRVIVPPLTNQYLNLTKNSSLAVFVGYPDLVAV